MGITRTFIPLRSACNCHGTMLEWCSIADTMTSSPSCMKAAVKLEATRFMLSVVPRVKMISRVEPAFMNPLTRSRAASCRSVACCDR